MRLRRRRASARWDRLGGEPVNAAPGQCWGTADHTAGHVSEDGEAMVSDSGHERAALVQASSGGGGLRRRPHAEGPRTHQIVVRLSVAEFAAIRAVTDRAGVVPGAWLGELGVRVAGGAADPVPPRWLDLVEDLVRCRQDIVQVLRLLGSAGEHDAATARRILARIDGITDAAAAAARSTR